MSTEAKKEQGGDERREEDGGGPRDDGETNDGDRTLNSAPRKFQLSIQKLFDNAKWQLGV